MGRKAVLLQASEQDAQDAALSAFAPCSPEQHAKFAAGNKLVERETTAVVGAPMTGTLPDR